MIIEYLSIESTSTSTSSIRFGNVMTRLVYTTALFVHPDKFCGDRRQVEIKLLAAAISLVQQSTVAEFSFHSHQSITELNTGHQWSI